MKLWKKCPLLVSLAVSGLIVTVVSAANRDDIYREYGQDTVMTPVLTVFFQGIKEEKYPWSDPEHADVFAQGENFDGSGNTADGQEETAGTSARTENEDQEMQETSQHEETADSAAQISGNQTDESPEEETQGQEETVSAEENMEPLSFTQVEESYFDDALFIGDSRTVGLMEYGGFGENVTFYSKTSLNIYDLFERNKAFIQEDGETLTLEQALSAHQFRKVYLMIGINELGTGTPKTFLAAYADAVNKIRELQPDALIFVQGIMRVGAQKNESDPIFNNENINVRNAEIETLADNRTIFYLDINEVVCDENGNLYEDWTFDQIHLKAKYYQVWKDYLMGHGILK